MFYKNTIIKLRYEEHLGAKAIRTRYQLIHPGQPIPSISTIKRLIKKFEEHNTVDDRRKNNGKPINEENHYTVLQGIIENPRISARGIEMAHGIALSSIHKIMKR